MTDRLHVDPAPLEEIAGAGAPAASYAGVDTPIFNELVARHSIDAPDLAAGPGAAAARATPAGRIYAEENPRSVRDINGGR